MTLPATMAPGLHWRALGSDPEPGPESAVAAFVGVAERGPLDAPQAVRNWGEYVDVFGGPWGFGVMAESVYAFFQNGGAKAYAVRVARELPAASPSPCPSQEDLAAARNAAPVVDAGGREALRLKAKSPGHWGNGLWARLRAEAPREQDLGKLSAPGLPQAGQIQVDFVHDFRVGGYLRVTHLDNAFANSRHRVTAIDEAQRRLSLDPPLPRAYPAGSRVLGPGFVLEVSEGSRREIFDDLSMNAGHPRYVLDVVNGPPGLAELDAARAGHSLLVRAEQVLGPGGEPRSKPADTPAPVAFAGGGDGVTFARATLNDVNGQPSLQITAKPRGRAGNELRVRVEPFTGRTALGVPDRPGGARDRVIVEDVRGWAVGDTLHISHPTKAAVGETALVTAVDRASHVVRLGAPLGDEYPPFSSLRVDDRFTLRVAREGGRGDAEPPFFNLSAAPGPRFAPDVVNGVVDPLDASKLICVHAAASAVAPPAGSASLAGGEGPGEMAILRYTGYQDDGLFLPGGPAQAPLGLAALEAVAEVNLVCLPDVAALPLPLDDLIAAHRQLLFHCQKMGERFALLDPPLGLGFEGAADWPGRLQGGRAPRFGAAYFPWLSVVVDDRTCLLPPSGVVAGLVALADATAGVGRAPANLACKGVVGLERDVDAAVQAALNERGVNCLRKFEDGALRLYGARTLSAEADHLYVNNRRLVCAVVKALSRNLLWAVFEPNDEALRRRVRDGLEGYFQGLLAKGLTAGEKPGDAYYVKVGGELEPEGVREAGELLAEVGLALSRPAEFVVIAVRRRPEIMALVEEET